MEIPKAPEVARANREGKVLPFAARLILPDLTRPGVVAVSGGADSVCLLRSFRICGAKIIVAHVNHLLRNDESDADAAFVEDLARNEGVPFEMLRFDAKGAGGNLEDESRKRRYAFFHEVAAKHGAAWIATGHTADDQAETVLMRMLRGSGLQGLRGIAPVRIEEGMSIHRPLLGIQRSALVAWLKEIEQPYREDTSNADRAFFRNRVRHELLPSLKQESPAVVEQLGRLAEQAREQFAFIQSEAEQALRVAEMPRAGDSIVLEIDRLPDGAFLRRELFRFLWQREGLPMRDMTASHWDNLANLVERDYPGRVRANKRQGVYLLAVANSSLR